MLIVPAANGSLELILVHSKRWMLFPHSSPDTMQGAPIRALLGRGTKLVRVESCM